MKQRLVDADPPANALVTDAEGVSDIDTTACQQFGELLDDLETAEVAVSMARVRQPVREMLERSGLLEQMGDEHPLEQCPRRAGSNQQKSALRPTSRRPKNLIVQNSSDPTTVAIASHGQPGRPAIAHVAS